MTARLVVQPVPDFRNHHDYERSCVALALRCACHPQWHGGSARRTGLQIASGWAVYQLRPTTHQELKDRLAVLTPDGLVLLERKP